MLKSSRRGFTLVEVMIVAALFSVVGVALFASFGAGLKVWRSASNPDFSRRKALLGIERFSKDLRRAVDYPGLVAQGLMSFKGDASSCSFFERHDGKLYNVLYSYYDGDGTVTRTSAALSSATQIMDPGVPRVVMTRVKDFALLYLGRLQLTGEKEPLDAWNSTDFGIPQVVKISLELENGERYERMVTLPIAVY